LGASSNVLSHSIFFYRLGVSFLEQEKERYSPEEQRKFLLGLIVHDFGEGELDGNQVGDIPWFLKTRNDEEKEQVIAQEAISRLGVEDGLRDELKTAYEEVVTGQNPKLHRAFIALEKTEYVITALKLYQRSKKREERGLLVLENRNILVGKVIVNNLRTVIEEYAPLYPNSIGAFCRRMIPVIEEAFGATRASIGQDEEYADKIPKFESTWEDFKLASYRAGSSL